MDPDDVLEYLSSGRWPSREPAPAELEGEPCLACRARPATHPAPDGRPGLLCDDCEARREPR